MNILVFLGIVSLLVLVGNAYAASGCPKPSAFPNPVVNYVCISLDNAQSTAVSANTQLMFTVNMLNYTPYAIGNLINTDVFFGNGTVATSWLEGNLLNEQTTTGLNTSNEVVYWFRSPATNTWLPANSVQYIYLGFAGTVANTANNLLSNTITGEAPQLSCNNPANTITGCAVSQYGEYDNGNSVFTIYSNFSGTTLSSHLSVIPGMVVGQDNGLNLSINSDSNTFLIATNYNVSAPYIYEADANVISLPNGNAQYGLMIDSKTSTSLNNAGNPGGNNIISRVIGGHSYNPFIGADVNNVAYTLANGIGISSAPSSWVNIDSFTQTSTSLILNEAKLPTLSVTNSIYSNGYLGFYMYMGTENPKVRLQWIRVRKYPPSGVMPSATFSSITSSHSPPTITISNNALTLDQGQSITFNGVITGGTAPYTVNVFVANAVTLGTDMLVNTGVTSGTTWSNTITTNSLFTTNSPLVANVVLTDSNPTTVTSGYTTNFIVNPSLSAGTPTESNSVIDSGQSTTLTANPSGGTLPYSYQWYTITGSTAPTCTSSNSISGATSSTYTAAPTATNSYAYQVTDSASSPVSICSSGITINVNAALGTPSISPSNPTIDSGQPVTFTSTWTGGTPDYTAKLYSSTTSTCNTGSTLVQTQSSLTSGTASFTAVTPTSTTYYCIFITDSATTPETTNSVNSKVTVNPALGIPTLTSSPTLPSTQNAGNTITFTSSWTGGTSTYTVNYLIVNSLSGNLVANML
ncbi:MAG: hypothetical protein ACYCU5_14210, partial [Actinomycetes bacterium]